MRFLIVLILMLPTVCLSIEKKYSEKPEDIWQAIESAMVNYQVKTNDMDKGIFETEFVSGKDMWKEPQTEKSYIGYRTKILIRMLSKNKSNALIIKKITSYKPDFFSDAKIVESNEIEEKVILYRIDRELSIRKKLASES